MLVGHIGYTVDNGGKGFNEGVCRSSPRLNPRYLSSTSMWGVVPLASYNESGAVEVESSNFEHWPVRLENIFVFRSRILCSLLKLDNYPIK